MLARKKKTSAKPAGPGELRRRKIFKSLHDCIEVEGYVNTSLQDIANRAEMSASHLCYYFSGKDAILLEYFESVSARILEQVEALNKGAPQEQIEALADFWFKGKARSRKEIGIMLECFGVAVNHEALCQAKNRFDETCKSFLITLFDDAPSVLGQSSRDAAEVCYALTIGCVLRFISTRALAWRMRTEFLCKPCCPCVGLAPRVKFPRRRSQSPGCKRNIEGL
jgi:AcrR family transcriptional regulator